MAWVSTWSLFRAACAFLAESRRPSPRVLPPAFRARFSSFSCLLSCHRMSEKSIRIAAPNAEEARALIPALAGILIDCVEGGASVSFMLPIGRQTAEEFYDGVVEKI